MITISATTDRYDHLRELIGNEYRLNELVRLSGTDTGRAAIKVAAQITILPDWENTQPPVLFPVLPFTGKTLLGIVYAKLNNYEKAYELLQAVPELLRPVDLLNRLQNNIPVEDDFEQQGSAVMLHNKAISMHYGAGGFQYSGEAIIEAYKKAMAKNEDAGQKYFTGYHLAQLYTDLGETNEAIALIESNLPGCSDEKIMIAYKDLLCKIRTGKLRMPYDNVLLETIKTDLCDCLTYYEENERQAEAAMVLADAAYIATISNSFSEALGYINRAIAIFETEQLEELAAQAHFTKGNLLQTWAQHGNPQFYRAAVQCYQAAVQIFTKEKAPGIFAEIQHQLGKVYAEIPDEVKKKGIWAAVSVSSFNEALSYYNKIDFPYEFAMICHSFGNAYTKYPAALHTDNFDKALAWYREALSIRTAQQYPAERCLTLSNYLEASWFAGNKQEFDEERYHDMMDVAGEIIRLAADEAISESAKEHMERLVQLKQESLI